MINDKLNLKPCPLCGGKPEIAYVREYSDKNIVRIECSNCGLALEHTQEYILQDRFDRELQMYITEMVGFYNESAIDLWNRRTIDFGEEDMSYLDDLFPKCQHCKSRPSNYGKTMCMCNEGMYIPKHPPRGQDACFQIGNYEEKET